MIFMLSLEKLEMKTPPVALSILPPAQQNNGISNTNFSWWQAAVPTTWNQFSVSQVNNDRQKK